MAEPSESSTHGRIWRPVVNFWNTSTRDPAAIIPLIRLAGSLATDDSSFLGRITAYLESERDQDELATDLDLMYAGFRVWQTQADRIQAWANRSDKGPYSPTEIRDWWWSGRTEPLGAYQYTHADKLLRELDFGPNTDLVSAKVQEWNGPHKAGHHLMLTNLRHMLPWLDDMDHLAELATKTWGTNTPPTWSDDDFEFVSNEYADQQLLLEPADGDWNEPINPLRLRVRKAEQGLGIGLWGLSYFQVVITRVVVIDFVDEILDHSVFPTVRGSLRCLECGTFAARARRGYGQRYCSERCKRRAAKRRNRTRVRLPSNVPTSIVMAQRT